MGRGKEEGMEAKMHDSKKEKWKRDILFGRMVS